MLLTNLILPLIVISLGLLLIENKKYLFGLSVVSGLITIIFVITYIVVDNYTDIIFIKNFTYPLLSMSILFCITFLLGLSFVLSQKEINYKELGFIILYFCSGMGIIFSENFITLIVYWELAAITATLVILQSKDTQKYSTALKYFAIHSLGGVLLIAGAVDYARVFGSDLLPLSGSLVANNIGNILILAGILINLAIPPFSSWLVDGYSRCSPIASVFLSVFTTKAALFILFKLFFGEEILIYIGVLIAMYGLVFSIFETSIRRILGFSIIHQLGIIIIGIATLKTLDGFLLSYISVDILYKTVLFISVAILMKRLHTDNIYILENSFNLKSITGIALLFSSIQALGLPITGGFIVKTYLVDNISYMDINWLNYVITILVAGVSLNVGIRIPYYLINYRNTSSAIVLDRKSKVQS